MVSNVEEQIMRCRCFYTILEQSPDGFNLFRRAPRCEDMELDVSCEGSLLKCDKAWAKYLWSLGSWIRLSPPTDKELREVALASLRELPKNFEGFRLTKREE